MSEGIVWNLLKHQYFSCKDYAILKVGLKNSFILNFSFIYLNHYIATTSRDASVRKSTAITSK